MGDEYRVALEKAFEDLQTLFRKREYLDGEIAKKKQYIRTAIKQLPISEQHMFESKLELLTKNLGSLTESVREALRLARLTCAGRKGFVTATQVRDLVMDSGFNFSNYKSNPLASVHTALTRLKPDEVETGTIGGVMHFRWKGQYTLVDVQMMEAMS